MAEWIEGEKGTYTGEVDEKTEKKGGGYKLAVKTDTGNKITLHLAKNFKGDVPVTGDYKTFHYTSRRNSEWDDSMGDMKMVEGIEAAGATSQNGSRPASGAPGGPNGAPMILNIADDFQIAYVAAMLSRPGIDITTVNDEGNRARRFVEDAVLHGAMIIRAARNEYSKSDSTAEDEVADE